MYPFGEGFELRPRRLRMNEATPWPPAHNKHTPGEAKFQSSEQKYRGAKKRSMLILMSIFLRPAKES